MLNLTKNTESKKGAERHLLKIIYVAVKTLR